MPEVSRGSRTKETDGTCERDRSWGVSAFDDECPADQCAECWSMWSNYISYDDDEEDVTLDGTFSKSQLIHIVSHLVEPSKE
jgi:hypothetical protein